VEPLLRAVDISKSFGTLSAISQLSLEIYPGEVVGLAGESGSGKSVLCALLAGLHPLSSGALYFERKRLGYPFSARELGIEIIPQTPRMVENRDITGNIFLGNEIGWPVKAGKWFKVPNWRRMDREATRILDQLDVRFDSLHDKLSNLSSEQRQIIAIARTMTRPAKLIIIDDPTHLLSYAYQQKLLSLIQIWQRQSIAVVFGTDNLGHLFAVTDRIIALRQGQMVGEYSTDETSREEVVAALINTADRHQLTPTIWALDSYYRAREQAERLRLHQKLLEKDLAAQGALNEQLVDQLAQQVKALDQANLALQDAQRRLLTEREEERKHLARELHDQVIQGLLSVNYRLEEIEVEENVSPVVKADLADVRESIRSQVTDIRRMCGDLRPPTLDSLGLGAAIQSYTRQWSEHTEVSVMLDLSPNLGSLPEAIELSVFRMVQEALNNVRKHARARAVQIGLEHTSPRTLLLSIADDGDGLTDDFDLSMMAAEGHYGFLGISERVALLGGRLELRNQADGGLLMEIEIPHPRVDTHLDLTTPHG
jgi:signal transduction histidine kinase